MKPVTIISQPVIYGLPAWPLAMLGIPLYVYLPSYYYGLGVDMALVGLMLLLARVADVFTDPLIGWLRDQTGHGGRYGLMIIGWLLLLVSLWQLLLPTQASAAHLLIWALVVYLAWTLIMIPYQALSAEVSEDYHVKTRFAAAREVFAILGVLTVLLLPFALSDQNDQRALFSLLYPLLLISLTLGLGLMIWRLKLLPLAPLKVEPRDAAPPATRHQAWFIWLDAASRTLLPAYLLNSLANALPATLFILFVQTYLELSAYTGLLLLLFFVAGILAMPLWLKIARRLGKYQAWRLSIGLACLSFVWVFALQSGDLIAFALVSFFSGLSLGADVALPSSIQADIAQRLSQQHGAMNGLLFGLWGMLTKLALALAVGLAFPLLDWVGWAAQTDLSMTTLLWLYAGLPIALKLVVLYWLRHARLSES